MAIRLLLAIVLLGASPLALAKLYKWTDENGQVHYSQTPPPELEQETDEVQLKDDGAAGADERGVRGGWWAITPKGIRTLFLDEKRFTVHRHTGKQLDTLYLGTWERDERRLKLLYTHDLKGGGREGESEDVIINRYDRTRLVAGYQDGRTLTYLRRNGNVEKTEKSELLMGTWTTDGGRRDVEFQMGEFEIRKQGSRLHRFAVGNWQLIDYETQLNLEYVYDLQPRNRLMGKTKSWTITRLDQRSLVLKDAQGKEWRMSRPRTR